jgi:5'-AMP-activated protein kinase regulatory beta subunit
MYFVTLDFVCDFTGTQGGNSVEVEGSFDNWQSRQTLHRSGNREFAIVMSLRPGVYQYKFIVDGQWKYAPDQPAMYDEMGNVNNVLEVQEYVPEILDSLDAFTAPASPPSSYDCAPFSSDDFAKDPPPLPPQLHMTLLNMPMVPDAPNLLPRPQHVVLNHTYCDGKQGEEWSSSVGYDASLSFKVHYRSLLKGNSRSSEIDQSFNCNVKSSFSTCIRSSKRGSHS